GVCRHNPSFHHGFVSFAACTFAPRPHLSFALCCPSWFCKGAVLYSQTWFLPRATTTSAQLAPSAPVWSTPRSATPVRPILLLARESGLRCRQNPARWPHARAVAGCLVPGGAPCNTSWPLFGRAGSRSARCGLRPANGSDVP